MTNIYVSLTLLALASIAWIWRGGWALGFALAATTALFVAAVLTS